MRVRFELVTWANTIEEARAGIVESSAKFLGLQEEAIPALVDFEYKVEYANKQSEDSDGISEYKVTAYGSVKNAVLRPGI